MSFAGAFDLKGKKNLTLLTKINLINKDLQVKVLDSLQEKEKFLSQKKLVLRSFI